MNHDGRQPVRRVCRPPPLDMVGELGDAANMTTDLEQMGPFTNEPELDNLSFQFFRMFARAEYALKAAGFLTNLNGRAEANWTAFAATIDPSFPAAEASDTALAKAVAYLLNHPPKKQMAKNGHLVWRDSKPQSESRTDLILLYVRRVRNNLFHGGKFSHEWIDPGRSSQLIQAALAVIAASIERSPEVIRAYHL